MIKRIFIFIAIILVNTACKPVQPVFNDNFPTQDCIAEISIVSIDKATGQRIVKAINDDFAYLDRNWRVGGGGDIDRVNNLLPNLQPIAIAPSLIPLIKLSQLFATQSSGLFNPAAGKLMELWGFHREQVEHHALPSAYSLQSIMQSLPKMRDLNLSGIILSSNHPNIKLDFSGLLQGYGVDLAIARIREFGIRNAAVKIEGVLRAIGNRDGQPWRIPIHRPAGGGIIAFVELNSDESMVTIGNYERSFLNNNRRYHEIIDPRTGYPALQTKVVCVLYPNAVTADAAAYALFVAGPSNWIQVAKDMQLHYVLLVDNSGVLYMTKEMYDRLKLLDRYAKIHISEPFESLPN